MSDQYYAGVSWLATGLTSKQLRDIGLVTVKWNAVEMDIQELIVSLAGWTPWQGHLVTADMPNVSRLQLALNLLCQGYVHKRLTADVERALLLFDECRKRRNILVHGMPALDDQGDLSGRLNRYSAKQAKGELKISSFTCTDAYLEQMIADLWLCRMALTDAARKVRRYRRFAEQHPSLETEKMVFEYTDRPLDTALVQSRVDCLRSLPPNQNTPAAQP